MFLGRGSSFPIALEGALKLKELSYLHAEGYPAGEMKHGPLALIEDGLPVIILAPKQTKSSILDFREDLGPRKTHLSKKDPSGVTRAGPSESQNNQKLI